MKRKGQLALADYHTGIKISNFYGIDPVDFACETAKLSLWISQYQMNRKLDEICSAPTAALPLTDAGSIVVGNALRVPWESVCPPANGTEIYIVGNPPYVGSTWQTAEHKNDMDVIFNGKIRIWRNLDYVSAWLAIASQHISMHGSKAAFVATNSICQGESVPTLWPYLTSLDVEIGFAHTSFKWANSAAKNAGVTCAIIGLQRIDPKLTKILYTDELDSGVQNGNRIARTVPHINAYLVPGDDIFVHKSGKPLNGLPEMTYGNKPVDGGHLLLNRAEKEELLSHHPEANVLLRPILGSQEFINGDERWCLWIDDRDLEFAMKIPRIAKRINDVRTLRQASTDPQVVQMAKRPHQFREMNYCSSTLVMPAVTSERRPWLQVDIVSDKVINNRCFGIFDPPLWLLSVLSSKMHFAWQSGIGGRLETRFNYSSTLVYNTFPLPDLSAQQKVDLEEYALHILRVREPYIADGKTIAWLYNPETMPANLFRAHRDLDDYLEAIYIGRPFRDDAERLEHLFKLYARMIKTAAKAA